MRTYFLAQFVAGFVQGVTNEEPETETQESNEPNMAVSMRLNKLKQE